MRFEHPETAHIPGLKALWKAAFGDEDAFIDRFFAVAFSPQRCCCITREDSVLAAAYWFDAEYSGEKAAYIYAVATLPAHQGQGLCRQLMSHIHSHLAANGYGCAILVPGNDGLRKMYGKMGYTDFGGMTELALAADQQALPVTEISPAEFAVLRRERLPVGGVVQEKENLAFLRQFYRFYRGEDCLFAAASTGAELFAAEFLGDQASIPGVLAALGASSGVFRVPGGDAFAMYHPLVSKEKPSFFSFAFD